MKKLIILSFALFAGTHSLFSQQKQVPFETIKSIADQNAKVLWGEVYPAEAIPYHSAGGEIIAYRFNYAIGQPFPNKSDLIDQCEQYRQSSQRDRQWGGDGFGRILMGATEQYPVFIEYSRSLSVEYARGFELQTIANGKLDANYNLQKIYYINEAQQWFCYSDGKETIYINLFPPKKTMDTNGFLNSINGQKQFITPADFTDEWQQYKSGKTLNPKAAVYIPDHELCPFYDWSYGCSPTAAAMLFGYWDYRSLYSSWDFGLLIEYYFYRWDGIEGEWDYQIPWMQRILAIGMDTDTTTGSTNGIDIKDGIEYAAAQRGYSFDASDYVTSEWNRLRDEIDAHRPLVASIPGHSTTGIGYNNADEHFASHYTHQGSIVWVHRDQLDRVTLAEPETDFGQGITLTYPEGDTNYNSTGNGEIFYMGEEYEITWSYETTIPSTTSIYYSINGNGGFVSDVIVYNTANDGSYTWMVPNGTYSDMCRLGVINYNASSQMIGMDCTQGMFTIYTPPTIDLLTSGSVETTDYDPDYFRFQHPNSSWCVVGVRAMGETTNWDIKCYSNLDFNSVIIESHASEVQTVTDFIVIDGNHTSSTAIRGIKVHRESGDDDGKVVYEGDNSSVSLGSQSIYFGVSEVAKMYEAHLEPGYYSFTLEKTSGSGDLNMALFGSVDGDYYQNLNDVMAISHFYGYDITETFTVCIDTEDDYGLCIWTATPSSTTWSLTIAEEFPGIWEGDYSLSWNQSQNWSLGIIPDASVDVVIPAGTEYLPIIMDPAFCNKLTIETGASLFILDDYLFVYDDMLIRGHLNIDEDLYIYVFDNVNWTSTASEFLEPGSSIYVVGDWTFDYGSDIRIDDGHVRFVGGGHSLIYCRSETSYFNHMHINKSADGWVQYEMTPGLEPLRIHGDFLGYSGCSFTCPSLYNIYFKGSTFYVPSGFEFKCSEGSFIFNGTSLQNLYFNPESYFNNLVIESTSQVSMQNPIIVDGDLTINSGSLVTNSHNIEIGGDWTNNVGPGAFYQQTGTVIFNGYSTQECDGEQFYNLELNKTNGELRFHEGVTECVNYNWTQGTMRVNGGTFMVDDLVDSGIFGTIIITDGSLEYHQDVSQFVDLRGSLTMSGGTFTVYGGGDDSYWPYTSNASITMSGGILDFVDNGIRIHSTNYSLTENITGGRIRTAYGFDVYREDFTPAGGIIELYGTSDETIRHASGSYFHDVEIDKSSTDYSPNPIIKNPRQKYQPKSGKASTITALSNLDINGDFMLSAGTFDAPGKMFVAGDWKNLAYGDAFIEGTDTVYIDGNSDQYCNFEQFYNLILVKSGGEFILNADDVFVTNYDWASGNLTVNGGGLIVDDLVDNGIYGNITLIVGGIEFHQGTTSGEYVDLCGNLNIQGGIMYIIGGSDDSYWPYMQNASLTMSGGHLDFQTVGIYLYNSSTYTFTENITGGTIKTSQSFRGDRTDFTPSGGIIELYGTDDAYLSLGNGSNFFNLDVHKSAKGKSTVNPKTENRSGLNSGGSKSNTLTLLGNVDIQGNLVVQESNFDLNGKKLSVYGNTNVVNGGLMHAGANTILTLAGGSYLSVANGGAFHALGSTGTEALITSESGYYNFKIAGGGMIRASHAIFENMAEDGIYVEDGQADPMMPFDDCTFRNGIPTAGACLLKFNNTQNLSIYNTSFPTNTGAGTFNVAKENNSGQIDFYDATGIFAGESFDEDPYNRINWTSTAGFVVSLTVFLEGPFNVTNMHTALNADGQIPLAQPYNALPWNYNGSESVTAIPNSNVVDWVLVETRDATSAAGASEGTVIGRQAAFVLRSGIIVGLDGASSLDFSGSISDNLFTVVYHRNHLGVISANPLTMSGGKYVYNYSTGETQVLGGSTGHKEIATGIWGMMGGDGATDGQVNNSDKYNGWLGQVGKTGYLSADFNLDCQVDNQDKNDIWYENIGNSSQIPD